MLYADLNKHVAAGARAFLSDSPLSFRSLLKERKSFVSRLGGWHGNSVSGPSRLPLRFHVDRESGERAALLKVRGEHRRRLRPGRETGGTFRR